ncbi:MAG TPA: exodeoxyribonuclease VII small subunit [Gemmatimonadaceae bacterium]|nr:exodeoxyribonuclease VII small subunit [Gemmatimonadaceae bacterium]
MPHPPEDSFESDLSTIETIVARLERDELPLDDALKLFEEGVERLRRAAAALAGAESKVQRLVESAGGDLTLKD